MTRIAAAWYSLKSRRPGAASLDLAAARPAIDRQCRPADAGSPNEVTWPQNGVTDFWTLPGMDTPFWATCLSSARGCQRLGSIILVPGSVTMSGLLTGA